MADGGAHSQSPRFFFCSSRGTLNLIIARTGKAPRPMQTEPSMRLWYF